MCCASMCPWKHQYCKPKKVMISNSFCTTWHLCIHVDFVVVVIHPKFDTENSIIWCLYNFWIIWNFHTGRLLSHIKQGPYVSLDLDKKWPCVNKVTPTWWQAHSKLNSNVQHQINLGWSVNSIQTERKKMPLSNREITKKGSSQLWPTFLLKLGCCKGLSD